MLEYPLLLVFPLAMALAGVMDLMTFTIPNRVSLALIAGFLAAAALTGMPWPMFLSHLGAGLIMLLAGFLMFSRGWIGGGDAKLMAAASLWLGFDSLLVYLVWTALLGGGLALLLLTYRRLLPPLWLARQTWAMRLHDPKEGIPYGIALAGAGLLVYPSTDWMTAFAG